MCVSLYVIMYKIEVLLCKWARMCSHELLIITKKEPFYFECQKLFYARRRQCLNLSLMFTGVMEISVLINTKRRMWKGMWPLAVRQAGHSTRQWHGMTRGHQSEGQLLRDQWEARLVWDSEASWTASGHVEMLVQKEKMVHN